MAEPEISQQLIKAHGISKNEYARILSTINRTPTFTELGIFSAMWNEHCSYKSSKFWLKKLPTTGPQVVCGPGENAGVVDIGDNQVVIFKMESHNHPSYIEPFQGAATGMGGILRDIFTMGARPIAAMNSLSFGKISHPKTKQLVNGIVSGIGGYGNCFGVPTVGGEIRFHPSYDNNCLVNAFAAGITDADKVFYSAASGVGMPIVYLGAKTGRDGVGGATMASAEFDDQINEKKASVQVGDPFTEKRLMEACLELMQTDAIISIQDMGAAGLTCSAVEMGDKGNLGIKLFLEAVPTREANMTAYEMMLSESQERMLMVMVPSKEAQAREICDKWDLDFAIIGNTIREDRFVVEFNGKIKADLPLKALSGNAPIYERPWVKPAPPAPLKKIPYIDSIIALKRIISDPNFCSKHWVYEQYDSQVMGDTVRGPKFGAGVVRVHGTNKMLAFTSDCTPRYTTANPYEGAKQAVAEAYRNLSSVGAKPLAITDNLNFGNPEKPEIMGQFVHVIKGLSEAAEFLNMPIVSGNVSLYNETEGRSIPPTPTIGAVGIIEKPNSLISGKAREGHCAILVGEATGYLGCSAFLSTIFNRNEGNPPKIILETESQIGIFVRSNANLIETCIDISNGGLALAAFKLAHLSGIGVQIKRGDNNFLFGEEQARYLIACDFDQAEALMVSASNTGIPIENVGNFTGNHVQLGDSKIYLEELSNIYSQKFEILFS